MRPLIDRILTATPFAITAGTISITIWRLSTLWLWAARASSPRGINDRWSVMSETDEQLHFTWNVDQHEAAASRHQPVHDDEQKRNTCKATSALSLCKHSVRACVSMQMKEERRDSEPKATGAASRELRAETGSKGPDPLSASKLTQHLTCCCLERVFVRERARSQTTNRMGGVNKAVVLVLFWKSVCTGRVWRTLVQHIILYLWRRNTEPITAAVWLSVRQLLWLALFAFLVPNFQLLLWNMLSGNQSIFTRLPWTTLSTNTI